MKVGLVLERFDPQRGGLEHWTWQFARSITLAGHEAHIISCEFVDPGEGIPLHWHPVEESHSPLKRAAAMENVLRGLSFDIIHDMGCGWYADIYHAHGGSTIAWGEHNLLRIPKWRQFRLWREKRYREQEIIEKRQQSQGSAVFVAVSQMVRSHFESLHNIPSHQIRLIHNGVDIHRFSPPSSINLKAASRAQLKLENHETVFLMVAHNLRLKNAEAAVRAIAKLAGDGHPVRLLIVGGKRPRPFIQQAARLGLSKIISFYDAVADVRPFYEATDVHLHPTWYDPCSLVALEALASGLPLVTTRYNGVSELMTDGEQGYLLDDPSDITTLAGRMKVLLDPQRRLEMGASARSLAMKYPLEKQTGEFLDLYAELVSGKS